MNLNVPLMTRLPVLNVPPLSVRVCEASMVVVAVVVKLRVESNVTSAPSSPPVPTVKLSMMLSAPLLKLSIAADWHRAGREVSRCRRQC